MGSKRVLDAAADRPSILRRGAAVRPLTGCRVHYFVPFIREGGTALGVNQVLAEGETYAAGNEREPMGAERVGKASPVCDGTVQVHSGEIRFGTKQQ